MSPAALLIAALWSHGGVGVPQQVPAASPASSTHIQQMNAAPATAGATEARQISAAGLGSVSTNLSVHPDRLVAGYAQGTPSAPTLDQLSVEGRTAEVGDQLAAGGASAGPPPSATERASGRVTSVSRPDGPDRCDPQSARRLSIACDRVIEARAGEFSSPDFQPLSPEQRLLETQRQQRDMTADTGTAARRLANGEIDESNAALAVASLALQGPNPDDDDESVAVDTTAIDAIVAGITTLVTGAPPQP